MGATEEKDKVFEEIINRWSQTSYGAHHFKPDIDLRLTKPLALAKHTIETSFTSDSMLDGAVCDALVFHVETAASADPWSALSEDMGLTDEPGKNASSMFACRCWILSAPTTVLHNLKRCRQGDGLSIWALPRFYGTGTPPVTGDVIKVRYWDSTLTRGSFIEPLKLGGKTLNFATKMWLSPPEQRAAALFDENGAPVLMSAFDDSVNFEDPCKDLGRPKFEPANLRPSMTIIGKVLNWEGFRPYVYDVSRQGRGRTPSIDTPWNVYTDTNHSGYIKDYSDAQGEVAIGVGHKIPDNERPQYQAYLKQNTSTSAYVPGVDPPRFNSAEVIKLLTADMNAIADAIKGSIQIPLTQNQFDALCSFAFNIGVKAFNESKVLSALNQGQCDAAAAAFVEYHGVSSPTVAVALLRRRKAEARLFIGSAAFARLQASGQMDPQPYDPSDV